MAMTVRGRIVSIKYIKRSCALRSIPLANSRSAQTRFPTRLAAWTTANSRFLSSPSSRNATHLALSHELVGEPGSIDAARPDDRQPGDGLYPGGEAGKLARSVVVGRAAAKAALAAN